MEMSKNTKQSGQAVTTLAAKKLGDPNASAIQKSLAGAVLAQAHTGKQTGADMEAIAGRALQSKISAGDTKAMAGSLVSQSNKNR